MTVPGFGGLHLCLHNFLSVLNKAGGSFSPWTRQSCDWLVDREYLLPLPLQYHRFHTLIRRKREPRQVPIRRRRRCRCKFNHAGLPEAKGACSRVFKVSIGRGVTSTLVPAMPPTMRHGERCGADDDDEDAMVTTTMFLVY
jgi:hypothetical protein